MNKVRVLVANRPRLMRELVIATIAAQPNIELVGETQDESQVTELVERTRPDIVIVGFDKPETPPGICGFLLGRYPQMRILAVTPDRDVSVLYWAFVEIRATRVENSEQGFLECLRSPEVAELHGRTC